MGGHRTVASRAERGTHVQLVEAAQRLRPDVTVTDISMSGSSGLNALGELRSEGLDPRELSRRTRTT